MNTVGKQILHKTRAMADHTARAGRDAMNDASLKVKSEALEQGRRDWHGRFRNMGRKGVKLNVRYDVKGQTNLVSIVRAVPPGAWAIAESGAKGHRIEARRRGRRSRGPKAVLRLRDGEFRRGVDHPGVRTKKHTWSKALRRSAPKAVDILHDRHRRAMVRGFKS